MKRMYLVDGQVVCKACLAHLNRKRLEVSIDSSGKGCSCCGRVKRLPVLGYR